MTSSQSIEDLEGEEIVGVGFVRDYFELYFDGPIIRFLASPEICMGTTCARFPDPIALDLLYWFIGSKIVTVKWDKGVSIKIYTDMDQSIILFLDRKKNEPPESLHFVPDLNQPISVL